MQPRCRHTYKVRWSLRAGRLSRWNRPSNSCNRCNSRVFFPRGLAVTYSPNKTKPRPSRWPHRTTDHRRMWSSRRVTSTAHRRLVYSLPEDSVVTYIHPVLVFQRLSPHFHLIPTSFMEATSLLELHLRSLSHSCITHLRPLVLRRVSGPDPRCRTMQATQWVRMDQ